VAQTVTIKIRPVTKALMEIYGAAITASTGSSPTNDDIIQDALRKLLPDDAVQMVLSRVGANKEQEK